MKMDLGAFLPTGSQNTFKFMKETVENFSLTR